LLTLFLCIRLRKVMELEAGLPGLFAGKPAPTGKVIPLGASSLAEYVDGLGAFGDPVADQLAFLLVIWVMLPSGMIWLATACA
jgi:hypothetical protein